MDFILKMDFTVLNFIQENIKNAVLDPAMLILSYIGEAGAVWIFAGVILLLFRKTRAAGVMVLAALAIYGLAGELGIKHLVARPRPFLVNTDAAVNGFAPSSYSFPSGHTGTSFAAAYVLYSRFGKRWYGAVIPYALALIIAFSRLYNYVHYPSDVLAGMVLGTVVAVIVVFVFKKTKLDKKLSGNLRYKG